MDFALAENLQKNLYSYMSSTIPASSETGEQFEVISNETTISILSETSEVPLFIYEALVNG